MRHPAAETTTSGLTQRANMQMRTVARSRRRINIRSATRAVVRRLVDRGLVEKADTGRLLRLWTIRVPIGAHDAVTCCPGGCRPVAG